MAKYTEARKKGNRTWDEKNLDRLSLALPIGSKEELKDHVASYGYDSVNSFIKYAIRQQMQRDQENL